MRVQITMIACALLVCATGTLATAQQHGGGGPGGSRGGPSAEMLLELADELGVNTEQQAKLEAIRADAEPQETELEKMIERYHHDLRGLMLEDLPDESAVIQAVVQLGDARTQLQVTRMRARLAAFTVLDQGQRDALRELVNQRRGRGRGEGGGEGRPGGGCGRR